MRTILNWLKSNFAYAFIIFALVIMGIASLGYAFLRTNNPPQLVKASPDNKNLELAHLPLAVEETADTGQPSQNGATLGTDIKCKDNESAMVAVNLKIETEKNRHSDSIKQIGLGKLARQVVGRDRENQRHQSTMQLLQTEYAELLAQADC